MMLELEKKLSLMLVLPCALELGALFSVSYLLDSSWRKL
jgi:hypothetical protein